MTVSYTHLDVYKRQAWNDMWEAMTEEEQEAYMKAEFGTKQ